MLETNGRGVPVKAILLTVSIGMVAVIMAMAFVDEVRNQPWWSGRGSARAAIPRTVRHGFDKFDGT